MHKEVKGIIEAARYARVARMYTKYDEATDTSFIERVTAEFRNGKQIKERSFKWQEPRDANRSMSDFYETKPLSDGTRVYDRIESHLPKEQPKPKRKRAKRPTTRTFAGLRGEKAGKEWRFTYPTAYAPYLLKARKDSWGDWSIWWGIERVGSGGTMTDALEQAKRRMNARGYHLV